MKKIILLCLQILLTVSCSPKKESPSGKEIPTAHADSKPQIDVQMATEELKEYLDKPNPPEDIAPFIDSIKKEYPQLLADIAFLRSDSMKGVRIDCIGVTHFRAMEENNFEPSVDTETIASQESARKQVLDSGYDLVSGDFSAYFGRVDKKIAIHEQLTNVSSMAKMLHYKKLPTYAETEKFLRDLATKDFPCSLAFSNSRKPYVIGTEPRWVYLTQQYLLPKFQSSPGMYPDIERFAWLLGRVRSEISYSRMAQYLLRNAKGQKGVLLYGELHVPDYREFQNRFGTIGTIM